MLDHKGRHMTLLHAIAKNPWSSFQDCLLIGLILLGSTIVALEFELFEHVDELTSRERRVSLTELMALSGILVSGLVAFFYRRRLEVWREASARAEHQRDFEMLREEASRDPLTDLPNRRALMRALAAATSGPEQDGRRHAFFLLDLDHFKSVNDREGHTVGDRVLKVVVERFRSASRPTDFLARLGGDEFAVIAYDVDRSTAKLIAKRFIASLRTPIAGGNTRHQLGVSVGVAIIPDDGITADEIIANADRAMYVAKGMGGSDVALLSEHVVDLAEIKRERA